MHEIVVNLHVHSHYSDGTGSHAEIAAAGLKAGLDAVITTDHNLYVDGPQGYYHDGDRKLLLLVGEEIHDRTRTPQKNHLLVLGAGVELADRANDLAKLIKSVENLGGLSFAAHPDDVAAPAIGEEALNWEDWRIQDLTGIEIWNAFSEFKRHLKTKVHALFYIWNPHKIAIGPFAKTLRKWDEQLIAGRRLVGIGGSDAHALEVQLGPLKKIVFPYEFHFQGINTHLLLEEPLSGEIAHDQKLIYQALRQGRAFVANDHLATTKGFSFHAHGYGHTAMMGGTISARWGITIQIRLPAEAECRLICNGAIVNEWNNQKLCTHPAKETGAYRVEVYSVLHGQKRGWIFSNPIYVTE
ncbi:MAG: hypothetical protein B6D39_09880 [Anaerolineae bacterium UTCFX2]|jgi:hypothetical protein|nr:CehA/McbA family metallohydrolase [Anaerolineales bacterium]OQY89267.1 MAG: hypothetical protein B6D39_09880 [Anaerolineae bacterium UTCFX2]